MLTYFNFCEAPAQDPAPAPAPAPEPAPAPAESKETDANVHELFTFHFSKQMNYGIQIYKVVI